MAGHTVAGCIALGFLCLVVAVEVSGQANPSNTALGEQALASITTGYLNTALGYHVLELNTEGVGNTASGAWALAKNVSGFGNVAIGSSALESNTTGEYNVATGTGALDANTTGGYNVATGLLALQANTVGNYNTATGSYALFNNTAGSENVAFGAQTLSHNASGSRNVAVGGGALQFNVDGIENVAIGHVALTGNNPTGKRNTALGAYALQSLVAGDENVALGAGAGQYVTHGSYNIYVGAWVEGSPSGNETNTIRIGKPYLLADRAYGQDRTFIAGIVENPLPAGNDLVGITSEGQLGTLDPTAFQGEPGPQGPAGAGFVPGSLLFLREGVAPPSSRYSYVGTTQFTIQLPPGKPKVLKVNIYEMQ